jgi:hypothetical protein
MALYWGITRIDLQTDKSTYVQVILQARWHYILAGVLVGSTFLPFLRHYLSAIGLPVLVFFAVWLGFAIGCGFDGRTKKRGSWMPLALEGFQIALIVVVVFLAYKLPGRPVGLLPLNSAVALAICGLCILGGSPRSNRLALPLLLEGVEQLPGRFIALVLLGCGLGTLRQMHFLVDLTVLGTGKVIVVDGLLDMALWSIVLGAGIGMVADLLIRGVASNALFLILAAILLLGGGIAIHLGLEPLWIGVVSGAWLINSTLRRRDLLKVLERGDEVVRIFLYFISGCLLGFGLREFEFQAGIFVWTLLVLVGLRPLAKWGSGLLVRALMSKQVSKKTRVNLAGILDIDDLTLALAAILMGARFDATGVAIFAAVWVGLIGLRLVSIWLDRSGLAELSTGGRSKGGQAKKVSKASPVVP